jgi:NAD(P)-dependent dehydrogenase (short-subunit alcohol dehydrogenase family)
VAAVQETVDAIRASGGRAAAVTADLSSRDELADMVDHVQRTLGATTILVDVAAPRRQEMPFEQIGPAVWQQWWDVCVTGPLECLRLLLPDMRSARFGRVVLVSAVAPHVQVQGMVNVAAAKGAMEAAARALASELGPHGITVNVVAPGPVDTVAITHEKREMADRSAIKRQSTTYEIAEVCRLLCDGAVGNITGQVIHASGGIYFGH